ncbi:hypothetical protein JTE90_008374 [Oedothorax gibbosus]|uniref:Cuticle protein n=1 Tax=Oedothorax gibbosus TaxID=931172 RepID=A0AAV6V3J3_9ARAC|nr:hypothetical protein JTE90_008374 [Oedothorax gibbosus]
MDIHILVLVFLSCSATVFCGEHPDGISSVSREQDALGNYRFSYSVTNNEGEQFRKEGTDELGRVIGSYGLTHADGTQRVVDYVADKDGFRASVRSNEPGVAGAEPAGAPIVKTHGGDAPLTVAATSNDDTRAKFGKRLESHEVPGVAYVSQDEVKTSDEAPKESRQYNFDDYRPLSPVAYYPVGDRPFSDPQTVPSRRPVESQRSPRVLHQSPEADSKPIDVYFPPIDPHSARRPPYYPSAQDRNSDRDVYPTTPSRRPFIPPYGGFDDDHLPESRRPEISMTTIHGGFGSRRDFPTRAPSRFPPVGHSSSPNQRDFGRPQFPSRSSFPNAIPPPARGVLNSYPGGILPRPPSQGVLFNSPNYEDDLTSHPNFVLRAVPIPNGIQAVRVDPTSGRVYERLMYPLFLRHDGYPAYDRNILLHNDEIGDDDASRDFDHSGNFDISFPNDSPFRGTRNPSSIGRDEDDRIGRSRRYNNTHTIDEKNLSLPTAGDLAWIHRQLSQVEGFERDGFDNSVLPDSKYRDSNFKIDEDRTPFINSRPSSRMRTLPNRVDFDTASDSFSRNPRNSDLLSVGDSKNHETKTAEISLHSKQIETEGKSSPVS